MTGEMFITGLEKFHLTHADAVVQLLVQRLSGRIRELEARETKEKTKKGQLVDNSVLAVKYRQQAAVERGRAERYREALTDIRDNDDPAAEAAAFAHRTARAALSEDEK